MTNQLRVPTAVAGIDPATACAEVDLAAFELGDEPGDDRFHGSSPQRLKD